MFISSFTQMLSPSILPPLSRHSGRRSVATGLHRARAVSIAIAAAMLLAACSTAPAKPAMVPIGADGNYGYNEIMLESDHYQVSYLTPRLQVAVSRADREADITAAKAQAHDLALWRAAQLGREKGFSVLKLMNEHTDTNVDTNVQRGYDPAFYGYGYGYRSHRYYPSGVGPFSGFAGDRAWGYGPYDSYSPYGFAPGSYGRATSSMQVNSRLEVKFFKTSTEQAQSIDTIIEDMSKKYTQATYP